MNRNYQYFLMVALEGNIRKAAEKLHITQPTLTTAIKKLEAELGVELFYRRSKGVTLTQYGVMFKAHVLQAQDQHTLLMHQFSDLQQREFGKLKLGTGEAWWELFIRDTLLTSQQMDLHSVHLEFGNNLALLNHLIHGEIDLFVGHEVQGLDKRCNVTFIPMFQESEALFVRKDHPLLSHCSLKTNLKAETEAHPLLRVTPEHARHQNVLAEHVKMDTSRAGYDVHKRQCFDVDSLVASVDVLKKTDAVMPYTSKLITWFEKQGLICLMIDKSRVGNVGIYVKKAMMQELEEGSSTKEAGELRNDPHFEQPDEKQRHWINLIRRGYRDRCVGVR